MSHLSITDNSMAIRGRMVSGRKRNTFIYICIYIEIFIYMFVYVFIFIYIYVFILYLLVI